MPRVEVYGVAWDQRDFLKKRLCALLKECGCAIDIIICFVDGEVIDVEGNSRQFLRIVLTQPNKMYSDELAEKLVHLKFDIEVNVTTSFIPAGR